MTRNRLKAPRTKTLLSNISVRGPAKGSKTDPKEAEASAPKQENGSPRTKLCKNCKRLRVTSPRLVTRAPMKANGQSRPGLAQIVARVKRRATVKAEPFSLEGL